MNSPIRDEVWERIRAEAAEEAGREPMLASFLHSTVLNHSTFEDCLSFHLAHKLGGATIHPMSIREVFEEAMLNDPSIGEAARADVRAVVERDPACNSYAIPMLYFKGFHSIQAYRITHWLWNSDRKMLAVHLQHRISEIYTADIHPGAQIGQGVFIDHCHSIVIGETAVIEDNVSMLQEVTLGGTGKQTGDRHPKIREDVLIGAGAKILGNVEVGKGAKVGAGSVVLEDVPPHTTVAGVPAVVVGKVKSARPAQDMEQSFDRANVAESGSHI